MISFGAAQLRFQRLAQDTSPAALAFFKDSYNVGQRILEAEIGSFWTEDTYTDVTVANQSIYKTPDKFLRLKEAYITVGNNRHPLEEIQDEEEWQQFLRRSTTSSSNIGRFIFVRRDTFEIYPAAADAGNVITLIYEPFGAELDADDYTEGSITALANGATAATFSGTTLTSNMVGRYIKTDSYPVWYELDTFTDTTHMVLDKKYTGTTILGAESYTIGQMPRTPEGTHQIPVFYGLMDYYLGFKQNKDKSTHYKALYEADLKRAKVTYKRRYTSNYISGRRSRARLVNAINYPEDMTY